MLRIRRNTFPRFLITVFILSLAAGCDMDNDPSSPTDPGSELETPDWTEATHGRVDPDYDIVFAQDTVQRLDIEVSEQSWQAMLADMTTNYGEFGSGAPLPPPGSVTENPIWVAGSVFHEGTEWYKVGIRFKGFSSLGGAWAMGVEKLPLKLDFDEFEDDYPPIDDQRFHGFKKLSLANGIEDKSLMRDKVVADVFRDMGLVAPRTAFYRIHIDHGDGPEYFGLYTMIEVVENTVLKTQYADDDGNLYKPEGPGASFEAGSFAEQWFEKKTNEDSSDWADIQGVFSALHSDLRLTDAAAWRSGLEQVLNVPRFIDWLAVNTVIQNWDTYGKMPHNYFLYHDPDTDLLDWIPWDNNEALCEGKQGGALSLALDTVGDEWPLIRFLMDDPEYRAAYRSRIEQTASGTFEPGGMMAAYQTTADLIGPHVIGPDGEQPGHTFLIDPSDFNAAVAELTAHVGERATAVAEYLAE